MFTLTPTDIHTSSHTQCPTHTVCERARACCSFLFRYKHFQLFQLFPYSDRLCSTVKWLHGMEIYVKYLTTIHFFPLPSSPSSLFFFFFSAFSYFFCTSHFVGWHRKPNMRCIHMNSLLSLLLLPKQVRHYHCCGQNRQAIGPNHIQIVTQWQMTPATKYEKWKLNNWKWKWKWERTNCGAHANELIKSKFIMRPSRT